MGDPMMMPQPRWSRPWGVLSWLAALGSLAVLTVLLLYIRGKDSNHTGFEPWLLSVVFAPTSLVGSAALLRGSSRWGAVLAVCLGLGGMAFLFYIDHFNVLVEHGRLGQRGGL
jgi:peptidoglycan/LPS O-acetylase OafA/YrhL